MIFHHYLPPEIEYTCYLPKDEGISCAKEDDDDDANSASSHSPRFHFDSETGFCGEFRYRGCGGNWNNFYTHAECTDFCGKFDGRVAVSGKERKKQRTDRDSAKIGRCASMKIETLL